MNNIFGLVNGGCYKIVNVADNSVIELNLQGNRLITRSPSADDASTSNNNNDSQTFLSKLTASGYFEVSSKLQSSPSVQMVWDYLPHRKALMQRRQSSAARDNQMWASETVPGMESTYFILSAPNSASCLRNMGPEKQIMLVPKSEQIVGDTFAHWKLERLNPVLPSQPSVIPESRRTPPPRPPPPVIRIPTPSEALPAAAVAIPPSLPVAILPPPQPPSN